MSDFSSMEYGRIERHLDIQCGNIGRMCLAQLLALPPTHLMDAGVKFEIASVISTFIFTADALAVLE